jgi:hypothetical protein
MCELPMWLRLSARSVAGYFTSLFCFPSAPLLIADDLVDRELLADPLEQIQMLSPVNRVAMRD